MTTAQISDREAVFRAVLDRIIPADDFPSACEAGVDRFILNLWQIGLDEDEADIRAGLAQLDAAEDNMPFAQLPPQDQDRRLERVIGAPWFRKLCELAAEGYYADPGQGANPDAVSWRMVGYRHGLPEGPDGPPADAADARRGRLWA